MKNGIENRLERLERLEILHHSLSHLSDLGNLEEILERLGFDSWLNSEDTREEIEEEIDALIFELQ